MKKYKLEIILFVVNSIYMILELIASRILAPYFGSTNLVWTSIIGIILLSTSIGNYLGGIIADKAKENDKKLKIDIDITLMLSGILILIIPLIQEFIIYLITEIINDIRIGAVIATLLLFFSPSMFIGMMTPIILKLKMKQLDSIGKTAGKTSALATLGSIVGTFVGGFILIPNFGSIQILFVLSIITFLLIFINQNTNKIFNIITIVCIIYIIINIICFLSYTRKNRINSMEVTNKKIGASTNFDTLYGKVTIDNIYNKQKELCRRLNIDKGNESATFLSEDKINELVYDYTKYYDLMFKSNKEIKDVLMIGGAGYSYPKYYISHFLDKKMDVVEIDGKVTEIAKKYFYLDKLLSDFNVKENKRLELINEDGRIYLNKNKKKYDAILNDAFSGNSPAKTLTTKEAIIKIYESLNENGLYLTNIISSIDGNDSIFIKAEVNTLNKFFKNVYVIPCIDRNDKYLVQNNMVIATDEKMYLEDTVEIDLEKALFLTDNYCPIETIIPKY